MSVKCPTTEVRNGLGISKMVDTIAQAFMIETTGAKASSELRAYTVRVYPRITHDNGIALSSAYRV